MNSLSELDGSERGRADARLVGWIALAAVVAVLGTYPDWAEWTLFIIVVGGLILTGLYRVYRRYGEPGVIVLARLKEHRATTGESTIPLRAKVRRSIALVRARVVFSDNRRGTRTRNRGDLEITGVDDGNSPNAIDEDAVRLSYALVEIGFAEGPLIAGPDDPIDWTISYRTSRPWSGRLVFIGYDEDGHRLMASTRVDIHPTRGTES